MAFHLYCICLTRLISSKSIYLLGHKTISEASACCKNITRRTIFQTFVSHVTSARPSCNSHWLILLNNHCEHLDYINASHSLIVLHIGHRTSYRSDCIIFTIKCPWLVDVLVYCSNIDGNICPFIFIERYFLTPHGFALHSTGSKAPW